MQYRVHIVGCQRSGTTLLMELMWAGFEFAGRCEHEANLFDPLPAPAFPYLTKKPPDTKWIENALRKDDALFVIAMQRDPRAVVTSTHESRPGVYFSSFQRWQEHDRCIERMQDHARFTVIRYEDLIADPDAVQARIQQRLPFLRQKSSFSQYPEGTEISVAASISLNGVRPISAAPLDNWRQHLPRIKSYVSTEPKFQAALEKYGYEPDAQWQACLADVEPAFHTYKEQIPPFYKVWETRARTWWKTRRYLAARRSMREGVS